MATYLYVKDRPSTEKVITVGKPAVTFVYDATQNKHVYTPVDNADFNAKADQLQKQPEKNGVIAGIW